MSGSTELCQSLDISGAGSLNENVLTTPYSSRLETIMTRRAMKSALAFMALMITSAQAQWLKSPTPGMPRTSDGRPDMSAPTPRTVDGKPDLSGVWQMRLQL